MSSFWSSLLEVFVHVSVSRSWRLAQTANTEKKAMTVASTTNAIGNALRVLALPASVSVVLTVSGPPVRRSLCPPRAATLIAAESKMCEGGPVSSTQKGAHQSDPRNRLSVPQHPLDDDHLLRVGDLHL